MIANLHIQTALRNNITYLQSAYYTPPFKVADITEDKRQKELHLMLMNSSPGILDGDEYKLKIEVAKNGSLHLHTQSYQRLFQMKKGAQQTMEVHLARDSSFCFLPHPVVPHAASIFSAKNKIFLSDGCKLLWGEVITCGRKLSGEAFRFSSYHNCTEAFFNNKLVVKENLLLQPDRTDIQAIGQLEGFTHQASLIYLNEAAPVTDLINDNLEVLALQQNIIFGISALSVNGLVVRLLGFKAEQLHQCLKTIAQNITQHSTPVQQAISNVKEEVYAS
ncbi:MAG: urease accessory protein UreD [Bacteroidota bacterium]|nr:urease accessory protein UreD [Bacteroidota bacterium]